MPRRVATRTAECATHGRRCRLGGGSPHVSLFCRPAASPLPCAHHGWACRWAGGDDPASARCEPMLNVEPERQTPEELSLLIRDAHVRIAVTRGTDAEEAQARFEAERQREKAEREAEEGRWSRLSCRQQDDELTARWAAVSPEVRETFRDGLTGRRVVERAELAEQIRANRARVAAELAAARVVEDAARVVQVAEDRHRSPQEPAPAGPGSPAHPALVDELAAVRTGRPRRGRRPRLRIVSWIDDEDEDGYDDF